MSNIEDRHIIAPSCTPVETLAWLSWRGYRGVPATSPGAVGGIVFARKNEPAFIATVGEVLVWDGKNVRVEE